MGNLQMLLEVGIIPKKKKRKEIKIAFKSGLSQFQFLQQKM